MVHSQAGVYQGMFRAGARKHMFEPGSLTLFPPLRDPTKCAIVKWSNACIYLAEVGEADAL